MTYSVGIVDRETSVDAWVFDLPGCRAIGSSVDEVVGLLPAVIGEYIAWLGSHGEKVDAGHDFKVVEQYATTAELAMEADKVPAGAAEVEQAVRYVQYAQADLVQRVAALSDAVMDWRVPLTAVKIDPIFPDVRSIRDMLGHVSTAMSFHIRGVGEVATRVPSPEGTPDLMTARDVTVARLRALTEEERSGRVYTQTGPRGESEWTARKAFRRIVNHQRFHAREIDQRLCWLTLGIPEVMPVSRE